MKSMVEMALATVFPYITFSKAEKQPAKTYVWECKNNKSGDLLGIVKWNCCWRKYCFFTAVDSVYSIGCLQDITDFIKQLK